MGTTVLIFCIAETMPNPMSLPIQYNPHYTSPEHFSLADPPPFHEPVSRNAVLRISATKSEVVYFVTILIRLRTQFNTQEIKL